MGCLFWCNSSRNGKIQHYLHDDFYSFGWHITHITWLIFNVYIFLFIFFRIYQMDIVYNLKCCNFFTTKSKLISDTHISFSNIWKMFICVCVCVNLALIQYFSRHRLQFYEHSDKTNYHKIAQKVNASCELILSAVSYKVKVICGLKYYKCYLTKFIYTHHKKRWCLGLCFLL